MCVNVVGDLYGVCHDLALMCGYTVPIPSSLYE